MRISPCEVGQSARRLANFTCLARFFEVTDVDCWLPGLLPLISVDFACSQGDFCADQGESTWCDLTGQGKSQTSNRWAVTLLRQGECQDLPKRMPGYGSPAAIGLACLEQSSLNGFPRTVSGRLIGCLGLAVVQVLNGALRMRGGGEDKALFFFDQGDPTLNVRGMILTGSGVMPRSAQRNALPISATSSSFA